MNKPEYSPYSHPMYSLHVVQVFSVFYSYFSALIHTVSCISDYFLSTEPHNETVELLQVPEISLIWFKPLFKD